MEGTVSSLLEGSLYFSRELFPRFFAQAYKTLGVGGRIVIVFSNIMELVQPDIPHPIVHELTKGRFQLIQKMRRKIASKEKKRRRSREKVEVWELSRSS